MPRTRFVWRLSSALCALAAVVLVGCFWVASVELARLADAALLRRLTDALAAVTKLLPTAGGPIDPAAFTTAATAVQRTAQVELSLLEPDGSVVATTLPPAGSDDTPGEAVALSLRSDSFLADARAGRTAITSSYDVARGRRILAMAVPVGPVGQPTAILRASTDTSRSDRELASSQRSILFGFLLCAVAAAAAAAALATRLARPVRELAQAAADVAGGNSAAPLPTPDVAELSTLTSAIHILREQLVERGLTIGRQDTEQEAVLDSMIEGVLAIDARQRVLGINRAAADLFELDMEADLGRSMQDVIRNPDLRRFALRAIDCREPVEDDIVLPGPRDRTIRVRGTALRDV